MCGPLAAALGPVMGIAKGVTGAMGAVAGYNAQVEDFNNAEDRWQDNYKLSMESSRDEQKQLLTKAIQMQTAESQKDQAYSEEGAIAAAEAEAGAAGAGVGGNTVKEVIRNITSGAAKNRHYLAVNGKFDAAQIANELKGTVTTAKGRIASVTRPTPPNPASAFLGIAGAALGAF